MNNNTTLYRIKDVLWVLFAAAIAVGAGRFIFGLGAATNMTDLQPWGFWKVFNMIAGAALATSGFVVAAIIYIFQMKKYRPVARISILIGFLGYGASLVALLFDIGLPHRGWHPFFMWNPHSFLFEVFWCVSIYWGVTALELLPLITERLPFRKFTHFLHEIMLPFVILGITLSTMHHSSLGSLFMNSPTRLYPLWYSLWIPPEFFISAMGAGLSVIVLVILIISRLYRQQRDMRVLSGLAVGSAALLSLYLVIKGVDFTINEKWNFVFGPDLTWESYLFWIEITLQAIVPVAIFAVPSFRRSVFGLAIGTSSALVGLVMHRLNTGITGFFRSSEAVYIPNLSELVLSFGLLSGAGLLFLFLVENFNILKEPEDHGQTDVWTRDEAVRVFAGARTIRILAIVVIATPLAWFAFKDQATGEFKPQPQPVHPSITAIDAMRHKLRINANMNDDFVDFAHQGHQESFMKTYSIDRGATCVKCHHLSMPNDKSSNCRVCHRDMGLDTPLFTPENHHDHLELEEKRKIHATLEAGDKKLNQQACMECHRDNIQGLASYSDRGFNYSAPGFKHAMHGLCQTCHRLREKDPTRADDEGNCQFCHKGKPFPTLEMILPFP